MKITEKRKNQDQSVIKRRREIFGLMLIAASFFLWAAYFNLSTGGMGEFFAKVLRYSLGLGAPLAPLAFLFLGVGFSFKNENWLLTVSFLAAMLFSLCVLGLFHHLFVPAGSELTPEYLPEGGGLIGGFLVSILRKVVGSVGTLILLITGIFLSILLTGKFSLHSSATKAGAKLHSFQWPEFLRNSKEDGAYEDEDDDYDAPATNEDRFASLYDDYEEERNRTPKTSAGDVNTNAVEVYDNADFSPFNDGLQKPSMFKRILDFVHEDKPLDEEETLAASEAADREAPEPASPIKDYRERIVLRPSSIENPKPLPISAETSGSSERQPDSWSKEAASAKGLSPQPEPELSEANPVDSLEGAPASQPIPIKNFNRDGEPKDSGKLTPASKNTAESKNSVQAADAAVTSGPEKEASAAPRYQLPPLSLLTNPVKAQDKSYQEDVRKQCAILEQTLADFKVHAKVVAVTRGPSVTRFELEPAPGVKVSSVVNLSDDIALRLAASGVRIEAPIPGKAAIGIEAPNIKNETVFFKEVVDCNEVRAAKSKLCVGLGRSISGKVITADLGKMPHLLVAGSTGSGKSVCINTLIAGLLYKDRPDEVKFILIDPKVVELSNYNGIPHLLVPVVTDAKKAASALHWAVMEMERRYQAFAVNHVRDIASYNAQSEAKMPFIVIVIDELSDLMMVAKADVEEAILRLAQKARAAGIHLVIATQRPSVDVITGIVKANIPSRIAFAVSSQIDSRTILDMGGAENLLGKGDMLFNPIGMNKPVRVQGAFVSDSEINKIVTFIKDQALPVEYSHEVTEQKLSSDTGSGEEKGSTNDLMSDELFEEAVRLVMDLGQASSSMLQRRFRIGYTRAARLVDCMEELGIVGPAVGSKPRELIMTRPDIEAKFFKNEEG